MQYVAILQHTPADGFFPLSSEPAFLDLS